MMLKVFKVETKQQKVSEGAIEVSQEPSAEKFISGLHEYKSEYGQSLDIFEENHRKIYGIVKML